jgi:peroxiredoxin
MKMKMLKTLLSVLVIVLITFSCGSKAESGEGVTISGKIEKIIPNSWARLDIITTEGPKPVDTTNVQNDGSYSLTVNIDEPSFYRLGFNDSQYVTLILTGEEELVEVNADGVLPQGYSEVSGSYDTQYLRDMDDVLKAYQTDMKRINKAAADARAAADVETFRAVQEEYNQLTKSKDKKLKDLSWNSLPSIAAFYGIQRLDPEQHFTFFDSISTELTRVLPQNPISLNLSEMIETKRSLSMGAVAPEIALENPDGEVIRLSSLRGNYVLVDFWAAWCKPCRAENPNIVRAYNKYKGQNFEVLGVSLDRTRDAWLKAIEQDGLPWVHISDLKFWNSAVTKPYQLNAIPASYLIDPEGRIIGKNLRGPLLEAKLKEIFGSV